MGRILNNLFVTLGKIFGMLSATFIFLFLGFLAYVWLASEDHLIKYDGTPCQNKIIKLSKPMKKGICVSSTMNVAFYRVTNNILQDIEEDYVTVNYTGKRYPRDSEFKVLGYYRAYLTGPMSGLAATGGSSYLVKSIQSKELFWIMGFDFDAEQCNVCDSFEGKGYGLPKNFKESNITKTEISS